LDGRYKINVKIGTLVKIEPRENRGSFVTGKVKQITSSGYYDSQGIKVILEDYTEGHVKEIVDEEKLKQLTDIELSKLLKEFEKKFRKLIVDVLSSYPKWWKTRVPNDVREGVEEKMSRGSKISKTLDKPEYEEVDFLDFDDYQKIITKQDNWRENFETIFYDKQDFSNKMNVLRSLRNDLQHNRDIDEKNKARFKIFCDDLFSQICKFYGKS